MVSVKDLPKVKSKTHSDLNELKEVKSLRIIFSCTLELWHLGVYIRL